MSLKRGPHEPAEIDEGEQVRKKFCIEHNYATSQLDANGEKYTVCTQLEVNADDKITHMSNNKGSGTDLSDPKELCTVASDVEKANLNYQDPTEHNTTLSGLDNYYTCVSTNVLPPTTCLTGNGSGNVEDFPVFPFVEREVEVQPEFDFGFVGADIQNVSDEIQESKQIPEHISTYEHVPVSEQIICYVPTCSIVSTPIGTSTSEPALAWKYFPPSEYISTFGHQAISGQLSTNELVLPFEHASTVDHLSTPKSVSSAANPSKTDPSSTLKPVLTVQNDLTSERVLTRQQILEPDAIKQEPAENVDDSVTVDQMYMEGISESNKFATLKVDLIKSIQAPFVVNPNSDEIQIVQFYPCTRNPTVKLAVCIDLHYDARISVHNMDLPIDHEIWRRLPRVYDTVAAVEQLLWKLNRYSVCIGNPDEQFQDLITVCPCSRELNIPGVFAYKECNIEERAGFSCYKSTIRRVSCTLLVQSSRCKQCSKFRRNLQKRKIRREEQCTKGTPNYVHSNHNHSYMDTDALLEKLKQQKDSIASLQAKVQKLQKLKKA